MMEALRYPRGLRLHAKTREASDKKVASSPGPGFLPRRRGHNSDKEQRRTQEWADNFPGAANIGDAGKKSTVRADKDLIPEAAVRPSSDNTDFHVGRGGAGNAHVADKKPGPDGSAPLSLADKLKAKIFGAFGKK